MLPPPDPATPGKVSQRDRDALRSFARRINPNDPDAHNNLGVLYFNKGMFEDAIAAFQRALDLDPAMETAHANLEGARAALSAAEPVAATSVPTAPVATVAPAAPAAPAVPVNEARLHNERGVELHKAGKYQEAQVAYHAALAANPSYAPAHNNLGVALYHAGNPAGAGDAFQRALTAQPNLAKARLNQALLFFKSKKLPTALDAYQLVLSTDDQNPVAWNGVGLVLAELKKFAEAKSAYARAIQARPKYAEAHYNMSFALSNLGDFEGALRETRLAIELEPYYVAQKFELALEGDEGVSIQPDFGQEQRVDTIDDFSFEQGAFDTLFRELGHTPVSSPAVSALATGSNAFQAAQDLLAKGLLERAQAEVTRAMALGADRIRGGVLLGDIFSRRGLWGEALERYRDVRREVSTDIGAMRGEATALLKLGRSMEGRQVAELLLPMVPGDVDALMLVATARGDAGDPRGGLNALELARRAAPTRPDVQKHIGDLAWKLRDTDAAITAYRNALQIDPQYAVARYQLANVLMERSLLLDAERELLLALDAVPTYSEATLALSRLLRRVGRPDDAMPLLIDLLQRDPYHFDGLIALGETLMELGKQDDAIVSFTRVLRFDPTHVGALYYEGAILVNQEKYNEAVERFQKVIDMAPASEYARKARRDIKSATDLGRRYAKQA